MPSSSAVWLRANPYFLMRLALKPNMSAKALINKFGQPLCDEGTGLLYQKNGASTMLWIRFEGPAQERICEWLILDAPRQEGYSQYTVRKHKYYGPVGTLRRAGTVGYHN